MHLFKLWILDADNFKLQNPTKFYNSITLLGEYYHRARIADKPVKILGQSLLQLLTEQLQLELARIAKEPQHVIDAQFSKLIVTQVIMNDLIWRYYTIQPHYRCAVSAFYWHFSKKIVSTLFLSQLDPMTHVLLFTTYPTRDWSRTMT